MTDKDYKWRWAHVDHSGRAEHYVEIINRLRADDEPEHFPNTMAWIDAQPGERLLEVGCGNGAVARALAHHVPAIRELIAVDASEAMIAEARRRASATTLPVSFAVADAARLPFENASFDRCYSMETFVILPDPRQAFMELARVTRPGGVICFWESDCDTHAMLSADLELARRLMRFVGDHEYNGAAARQIIGLCKELGWRTRVVPAVSIGDTLSDRLTTLLDEWLADARTSGALSPAECEQFLEDVRRRHDLGTFFSYTVNFRITATKPA